jgi:hypothetical protein
LDDALVSLGCTRADVYIQPDAPFSLKNQVAAYGDVVATRLVGFVDSVQIVPSPPNEVMLAFEDTDGIDFGESVLYGATMTMDDFLVVTDDKRSLRSLASAPECAEIVTKMSGKVVCFLQVVERCIGTFGFEAVRSKVVPGLDCDTAIRAVFGSGFASTERNVNDGLASYIRTLRTDTGSLLVA